MKCPVKKRVLFQKDMFEKRCAVVKSPWWHVEKIIIYWENHHVTHRKILCQVFKIKWSEIVWYQKVVKKENYSEENIVSIHWQILQLLILAVPVHQVSKKKTMLSRQTNLIIVFFTYVIQYSFVNASFLTNCFCYLRYLCQISLQWNLCQWSENLLEL